MANIADLAAHLRVRRAALAALPNREQADVFFAADLARLEIQHGKRIAGEALRLSLNRAACTAERASQLGPLAALARTPAATRGGGFELRLEAGSDQSAIRRT